MRLSKFAIIFAAVPQLFLVGACHSQENGSGRTAPDGSDIATTGSYNGHDTHGEGAGSVAERNRNEQSGR
jgi:hypothetical protein